jgi:peptidoglycan-N-acetylglucosamine deacetylase
MSKFEARGYRATFFVIGKMVREQPGIARDIVNRGHTIANHTMTHSFVPNRIANEIVTTNDLIEQVTGVRPVLFRSPGLTRGQAIQDVLADEGMCNIFSTADLRDYVMPRRDPGTLCASFAANLHPGFIVLLHDGGGSHQNTIDAIDCMLDVVQQSGYSVVDLPDLLREGRHYFGARQISASNVPDPGAHPPDDLFSE